MGASAFSADVPLIHRVYRLAGNRFRKKRIANFISTFRVTPETRILDVGGTRHFWRDIPARVTVVNLDARDVDRVADARDLPFADGSFDIAFSNSLIEHVGTFQDQIACAREIARVGLRYYVQTPNRWFPVEPHLLAPFIHWLPAHWQKTLARFTPWAIITRPNKEEIARVLSSIRLLTCAEMRELFPGAELHYERFCGLNKSLIARRL